MTTVIFACPKCGLVHEVTQVHVPTKKSGGSIASTAEPQSTLGMVYSGCRAVRAGPSCGNAALILRLQILRHLRDRQIQRDVV
jgi:predicted RNA-binding Zn-ribbon protein involved in translation (DUF1610 family)